MTYTSEEIEKKLEYDNSLQWLSENIENLKSNQQIETLCKIAEDRSAPNVRMGTGRPNAKTLSLWLKDTLKNNPFNTKEIKEETIRDYLKPQNELLPSQVTLCSGKTAWWKCENGHSWERQISYRNYGSGCPYCPKKTDVIFRAYINQSYTYILR